jgi:hypothetical protein
MKIKISHKGDFMKTQRFLRRRRIAKIELLLRKYGDIGVTELGNQTPRDTGEAASSWYYDIERTSKGWVLHFMNSDMVENTPLVILLQYGHGTRGGTYILGRDFINPAIKPVMDSLSATLWKEVISE